MKLKKLKITIFGILLGYSHLGISARDAVNPDFSTESIDVGNAKIKFFPKLGNEVHQKIDFAYMDKLLKDSGQDGYSSAGRSELLKITEAKQLLQLNQEQLDQLYARLPTGAIPTGQFNGDAVIREDTIRNLEKSMFDPNDTYMGKLMATICNLVVGKEKPKSNLECLASMVWAGKQFYPRDPSTNVVELRNAINNLVAGPMGDLLWGFGFIAKNRLQNPGPGEQKVVQQFAGKGTHYMLFPAHVYCGQSLLDSRRESIIIDYAYGRDFKPFYAGLDTLVGKEGFDIRDEVRLVRPGLYLGRAYIQKMFVLNFILENKDQIKAGTEWPKDECWNGKNIR